MLGGVAETLGSAELDLLDGLTNTIATDATAVTNLDGTALTITAGALGVTAAGIGTTQIGTDGVSADELTATGVEAELEAGRDLEDMQGAVTDGQVPNNITIDLATLATTLTITDNEATAETNAILFTAGGDLDGGNLGIESDGDLTYTPNTGNLSATQIGGITEANLVDLSATEVITGSWDFGGATDFEIPNAAAPTAPNVAGEIVLDTNLFSASQGTIVGHDGTQVINFVSTTDTPGDNEIPKFDSGTGTVTWEADASAGATAWDVISDPSGDGDVAMAELDQDLSWNTAATTAAFDGLTINLTNDATSDAARQVALLVNRPASSGTATVEALLEINNEDTDGAVTAAIEVVSAAGVITNALLLSDSDIVNWADIGANDLITSTATITSAEIDRLDGLAGIIVTDVTSVTNVDGNSLTISAGTLDVDAASVTVVGAVEIATAAEVNTGTDAARAISPDSFAGSNAAIRYVPLLVTTDFDVSMATGDNQIWFHIPPGLDGMNLVYVHCEMGTAGTTGTSTIQVHNVDNALDMLSTLLSNDTGETGSDTAASAAVINASNDHVNTNDVIRIDVDAIHSGTAALGPLVTLGFQLP